MGNGLQGIKHLISASKRVIEFILLVYSPVIQ